MASLNVVCSASLYMSALKSGFCSATVAINLQRTETNEGQALEVFDALQRVEQAAICLLLESP